jgi:hypothetical protein
MFRLAWTLTLLFMHPIMQKLSWQLPATIGLTNFELSSNCDPPDLHFLNSWNHRCELLHLAKHALIFREHT